MLAENRELAAMLPFLLADAPTVSDETKLAALM